MNEVIFSHRPRAGVSVAATTVGDKLFFAVAFVNDGTSRNQVFHPERRDAFSRPVARNILKGRLAALENGIDTDMGVTFSTSLDARAFMAKFRETFKPDQDESDEFLFEVERIVGRGGAREIRTRLNPSDMLARIFYTANDIVSNVNEDVPF